MTERQPVGPKLRFEVFKRDKFTCMYCGAKAPEVVEVPDGSAPWWADVQLWPKVDCSHDDWPAHLRFEDDPRACRPEPRWIPVRTISDRMSYCSNATAWAAL